MRKEVPKVFFYDSEDWWLQQDDMQPVPRLLLLELHGCTSSWHTLQTLREQPRLFPSCYIKPSKWRANINRARCFGRWRKTSLNDDGKHEDIPWSIWISYVPLMPDQLYERKQNQSNYLLCLQHQVLLHVQKTVRQGWWPSRKVKEAFRRILLLLCRTAKTLTLI